MKPWDTEGIIGNLHDLDLGFIEGLVNSAGLQVFQALKRLSGRGWVLALHPRKCCVM